MKEIFINDWIVQYDPDKTSQIYKKIERGYSGYCSCQICKHYSQYRNKYIPEDLGYLIEELGIDITKEAEVSFSGDKTIFQGYFTIFFHFIGSVKTHPNGWNICSAGEYFQYAKKCLIRISEVCEMQNPLFFGVNTLQISLLIYEGISSHDKISFY